MGDLVSAWEPRHLPECREQGNRKLAWAGGSWGRSWGLLGKPGARHWPSSSLLTLCGTSLALSGPKALSLRHP